MGYPLVGFGGLRETKFPTFSLFPHLGTPEHLRLGFWASTFSSSVDDTNRHCERESLGVGRLTSLAFVALRGAAVWMENV